MQCPSSQSANKFDASPDNNWTDNRYSVGDYAGIYWSWYANVNSFGLPGILSKTDQVRLTDVTDGPLEHHLSDGIRNQGGSVCERKKLVRVRVGRIGLTAAAGARPANDITAPESGSAINVTNGYQISSCGQQVQHRSDGPDLLVPHRRRECPPGRWLGAVRAIVDLVRDFAGLDHAEWWRGHSERFLARTCYKVCRPSFDNSLKSRGPAHERAGPSTSQPSRLLVQNG